MVPEAESLELPVADIEHGTRWLSDLTGMPSAFITPDGSLLAAQGEHPVCSRLRGLVGAQLNDPCGRSLRHAGELAMQQGRAVVADSPLGPGTVWACPVMVGEGESRRAAGALAAFAHALSALASPDALAVSLAVSQEAVLEAYEYALVRSLRPEQVGAIIVAGQALCELWARAAAEPRVPGAAGMADSGGPLVSMREHLQQWVSAVAEEEDQERACQREVRQRLAAENERLREALRARNLLMASMSHELRTPLNGIIGLTELLRDGAFGEVNPEQATYLSTVESSGRHLVKLIDDLLDIATIETGRFILRPEPCAVSQVLAEALQAMLPMARSRGVALRSSLPGDDVIAVLDPERLRQVAVNLLSNAIKFSPEGQAVLLSAQVTDGELVLRVQDHGPGIPVEEQAAIFDEFRRGTTSLNVQAEGLGLGLPLVKRLVTIQGGSIELHSAPGSGSEFVVRIPTTPEPARAPGDVPVAAAGGPDLRGSARSAVVLEEEEASRAVLCLVAKAAGLQPVEVGRPGELLATVLQLRPAVVLCGAASGSRATEEALRALRQAEDAALFPVVFVGDRAMRERALQIGVSDTAEYSVNRQRLAQILQRIALSEGAPKPRLALIMDDNPGFSDTVAMVVEATGMHTLSTCDGLEGIEMAKRYRPDIVLLDLMLPRANGWQVIKALREDPLTRETPVAVLTVKPLTPSERANLEQQAEAVISKASFTPQCIWDLLDRLNLSAVAGSE